MINSGSGASVSQIDNLNRMTRGQSFGSSTHRFDQHIDKKQGKLPGPGKYYGFSACGPGDRSSPDARSLDQ